MKPILVAAALMAVACGGSPSEPDAWADSLEISVWVDISIPVLHLEWTRFPGTYALQRRILPSGGYDLMYAGTDTSYIDSSLVSSVIFRYRVCAYDGPDLTASDSVDVQIFF